VARWRLPATVALRPLDDLAFELPLDLLWRVERASTEPLLDASSGRHQAAPRPRCEEKIP
jgi:hypothetical protein